MAIDYSDRQPRSGELYAAALLKLLPNGFAWNKKPGSTLSQLMLALAESYARVDEDKCQLINNERTPTDSTKLLADWEAFLGLPECGELSRSIPERQYVAASKLRFYGSMNYAFYEKLAATYGYEVTIKETKPYVMDVHVFTDVTSREATVLDDCETPLTIFGATDLFCAIERYKPAHETVVYLFED